MQESLLDTLTSMTAVLNVDFGCRKENVQKASKWSEQKLPQKSTLVQPAIPVLDIPVDDDIQNQQSLEQPHSVPQVVTYMLEFPIMLTMYHSPHAIVACSLSVHVHFCFLLGTLCLQCSLQ